MASFTHGAQRFAVGFPFNEKWTSDVGRLMGWYACSAPEREPDQWTWFHIDGCNGCRLAMDAAKVIEPKPGAFRGWWEKLPRTAQPCAERGSNPRP